MHQFMYRYCGFCMKLSCIFVFYGSKTLSIRFCKDVIKFCKNRFARFLNSTAISELAVKNRVWILLFDSFSIIILSALHRIQPRITNMLYVIRTSLACSFIACLFRPRVTLLCENFVINHNSEFVNGFGEQVIGTQRCLPDTMNSTMTVQYNAILLWG